MIVGCGASHLTEAGLAERAELDRRSDDVARGFLEPLSEGQRARLVAAMAEVERLLRASTGHASPSRIRRRPDARWCIEQYIAELNVRFDGGLGSVASASRPTHTS